MRTLEQLLLRLELYQPAVDYLYDPEVGYIVWRTGTGENLEILFIEAAKPQNGFGTELVRQMVKRMVQELERLGQNPYHSVFAFRLQGNQAAARFYESLGFREVPLGQSIYRDDGTAIVWTTWRDLLTQLKVDDD